MLIASVGTTKISVIERINLLNCQVVADVCGKSLGILITYDGTPPEWLVFEASELYARLKNWSSNDDLTLFGDNSYIHSSYMATLFPNIHCETWGDYNYFHSQVSTDNIFIIVCLR